MEGCWLGVAAKQVRGQPSSDKSEQQEGDQQSENEE